MTLTSSRRWCPQQGPRLSTPPLVASLLPSLKRMRSLPVRVTAAWRASERLSLRLALLQLLAVLHVLVLLVEAMAVAVPLASGARSMDIVLPLPAE